MSILLCVIRYFHMYCYNIQWCHSLAGYAEDRPKSYGQDQDRDCRTAKSARESQLARYIWKNRWNIDTTIPCEMDSMPGLWSVLQWKCLVSESRETKEKQTMKPLFSAVYTLKMILPGGWTPCLLPMAFCLLTGLQMSATDPVANSWSLPFLHYCAGLFISVSDIYTTYTFRSFVHQSEGTFERIDET